jgi:exonuclease SbcC
MKILSLHFKNINSLEGENRINFEQSPFVDSGVFAITGPNGSGKSSVLDAITLGLYGETFRFDQPAAHIMTQHTREAFAEVVFALGDDRYQSSWRSAVDDAAEHAPPSTQMQVTSLADGAVLATGTPAVNAKITELTGMNFRNFTRAILLAQGDSAAFLNALDSERMDILEKIIGTDIYADYRQNIIDQAHQAQQAVDGVKQELAAIRLPTPAQQEADQHDLLDYQQQLQDLQREQKTLEQQQLALRVTADLQTRVVEQKKHLKDSQAQWAATEQTLNTLAEARLALAFQGDLAAIDEQQQILQQHQSDWRILQNELQFLSAQLGDPAAVPEITAGHSFAEQQQRIDELKLSINELRLEQQTQSSRLQTLNLQAGEKKAALATVDAWLAEHPADEALLDNFPETAKLKKLRAELRELTGQHKELSKNAQKSTSLLKSTVSTSSKADTQIIQLKQQLAADEQALKALLQGYDPAALDDLKTEQQTRVNQFQALHNLAQSHYDLSQPAAGLLAAFRKAPVLYDVDVLTQELAELRETLKREENIKLALDHAVAREALFKKLAPERVHLADGKPCPLCGATQHPYLKRPPVSGDSVQALVDQQLKLRTLSAQADSLTRQIATAQKQAEKNQSTQAQQQRLKADWQVLCNRLNAARAELDISNLNLHKELLKNEQDDLKNIIALDNQYRSKTASMAKTTALIAKNEATVSQLQQQSEQLGGTTQDRRQAQIDLEAALVKCRQEEQLLAEKVQAQLLALGETMPGKGKEDAFFDRLNSRRQDYQTAVFRRKALREELAPLETEPAACEREIARCEQRIDSYTRQLQTAELICVQLALQEKQRLMADKQPLLDEQEARLLGLQQSLQERLLSTPFNSSSALRGALQLLGKESEVLRRKADIERQIAAQTQQLEQQSAQLEADFALAETAPDTDELYRQLTLVAEKMDITQLEIQRLERHNQQQAQLQHRYDTLSQTLQRREQQAQPALQERDLLDSENGMVFRRRVQTQLTEKLLRETNRILEKISGRYYLRARLDEPGLALDIEDTYQRNARRQPQTLSGGESFVVSLGLALALSELANNGKAVDSLFIDEGFGNLDADSLFTVISTLESLRAHGKTVGIISHVEAVKKRIKAQLQVVKKPNGLGMLKQAS